MAPDLRSELSSEAPDATDTNDARSAETMPETTAGTAAGTAVGPGSVSESGATGSEGVSEEAAGRADLNLVSTLDSPASDSPASDSQEPGATQETTSRGIPVWIVLVGLVLAALLIGYQMRINGQLEAEVTGLEAKLGRTEAVLDAHRTHLGDIRGGVQDLSARMQSLQALVETEPVVARDESASPQP